ncbi:MAG TPA: hypothetical protein VNG90_00740 [Candidatus Acidoferrum sp.]|nr:hypothetical protein [Candidatus Acidoferrum sp.]
MPQQDFVFVFDSDTVVPSRTFKLLGDKIRGGETGNRVFYVPFPDIHTRVTYESLLELRTSSVLAEMDKDGVSPKPIGIGFGLGAVFLLKAASMRDFGKLVLVCPSGFYSQPVWEFLMHRLVEEVVVQRTWKASLRYIWPFWQRIAEAQISIADFSALGEQLLLNGVEIHGVYGEHDHMFAAEQLQKSFRWLGIPAAKMPHAGHYLSGPLWLAEHLKAMGIY